MTVPAAVSSMRCSTVLPGKFFRAFWQSRVFLVILVGFLLLVLFGCSKKVFLIKVPSGTSIRGECVVLLHGLGRTYHSMNGMQAALTEAGFHTVNLNYPSTKKDIEAIAEEDFSRALEKCGQFSPTAVHFVTHSLGGIIVRQGLSKRRVTNLGRVVMLSPPNHGSAVADKLQDWWFYIWLNGPAGQQLSTAEDSVPNRLGRVDYPVGIIAGDRHAFFDAWFSRIIPGKDDGKVSVERTKVDGMGDFLVVHESHPFIMNSDYVMAEVIHFLENGTFMHQQLSPSPGTGTD